jgi:hypothetical protein
LGLEARLRLEGLQGLLLAERFRELALQNVIAMGRWDFFCSALGLFKRVSASRYFF